MLKTMRIAIKSDTHREIKILCAMKEKKIDGLLKDMIKKYKGENK